MKERLGIGVVGCGYWGPNLIRNFYGLPDCELKTICDLDIQRLNHLKSLYPKAEISTEFQELIARPDIDALVVATSATTHSKAANPNPPPLLRTTPPRVNSSAASPRLTKTT